MSKISFQTIYTLLIITLAACYPLQDSSNTPTSTSTPTSSHSRTPRSTFPSLSRQNTSTPPPSLRNTPTPPINIHGHSCIGRYEELAYEYQSNSYTIPPLQPWTLETNLPSPIIPYKGGYPRIELTRIYNGIPEIWITRTNPASILLELEPLREFLIYTPISQEWKIIPADIADADLTVHNLFTTEDGRIWGHNSHTFNSHDTIYPIPALSIFNDLTGRFEVVEGTVWITDDERMYATPYIRVDNSGRFWVFIQHDGLYSYNPENQELRKYVDIPDLLLFSVAFGPEGSIYIQSFEYFNRHTIEILRFSPETGDLSPVPLSNEPWPGGYIYFDQSGNLWIGTVGFRDTEGKWHLLHNNLEAYFSFTRSKDYLLWPGQIVLESSNGLIWIKTTTDGGNNGTAWFDPLTLEGCWFTDYGSNVVEDDEHHLWMIVKGILYTLNIEQE